jgi:L,D-peptidoglycan transpeptidase YkuD (ErfK/YbiS/YcfS/YnhG family)
MNYKLNVWLAIAFILISTNSFPMTANSDACQILHASEVKKMLPHTSQMIVVKSLGGIKASMTLCQWKETTWQPVFNSPFSAVIGKNGMASIGKKKEGDLKTPAGLYPIGETFGTQPLALKMDYKYITPDDKFIDDVNHQHYNMWVSGPTDAKSYESMLMDAYTFGAVINYNMNPTVAGAGSAIFIHLWQSPDSPTAGCVALEKKNLLIMLQWLDKAQHPYIFVH